MTTPPKAPPTPERKLQNLSDLALFIANPVSNAMQASYVTYVTEAWFYRYTGDEMKARFRHNPVNCLQHAALTALEERAIVTVAEILEDKNKIFQHDETIRGAADLYLHRHALSHPVEVAWTNKKMIPFAEARRPLYDWRVAILWDLQKSMNELLIKAGQKTFYSGLTVTREMGVMLHNMLEAARQPTYLIPNPDQARFALEHNLPAYIRTLEKYPDGQVRDAEDVPELEDEEPSA